MYIKIYDRALALARAPTELNYGEILTLSYIHSFYENGGRCFATNKALADVLETSERTVKRWIQNLKEKKLVDVYYEDVNGVERRVIGSKLAI